MLAEIAQATGTYLGLMCPKCRCRGPHRTDEEREEMARAGRSRVSATRPVAAAVRRYRICRACGHHFTTTEVVDKHQYETPVVEPDGEAENELE